MNILRKLGRFFRLRKSQRRLAASGIAWVAFARLGLWLLPFRVMQRVCDSCGRAGRHQARASVREIAWAIELASRYVPRTTCLVQAMATRILLGRNALPGRVHIGVGQDDRGFHAHAWVESQGVLVSGGAEASNYTSILVCDTEAGNGLPISRWCPNGSTRRPKRQPY